MVLYNFEEEQAGLLSHSSTTTETERRKCYNCCLHSQGLYTTVYITILIHLILAASFHVGALEPVTANISCSRQFINCDVSFLSAECDNRTIKTINTREVIHNMHFDFCQNIHPLFTFGDYDTNDPFIFNLTDGESLNVSALTCEELQKVSSNDSDAKDTYNNLEILLSSLKGCTASSDRKNTDECSQCKLAYKNWLCLSAFDIRVDNKSNNTTPDDEYFKDVCYKCPALSPEESYGGYSALTYKDPSTTRYINYAHVNKSRLEPP